MHLHTAPHTYKTQLYLPILLPHTVDFGNYIAAPTDLSNFQEALSKAQKEHDNTINRSVTKPTKEKRNISRRLNVNTELVHNTKEVLV